MLQSRRFKQAIFVLGFLGGSFLNFGLTYGHMILDPATSAPEGLSLKRNSLTKSISGVFKDKDKQVSFIVRRGQRIRGRHKGDPKFEMDVCIKDSNGVPLFAQIGGDEVLIPECDPDQVEDPSIQAEAAGRPFVGRQGEYKLATRAMRNLKNVRFRRKYQAEHEALLGTAEGLALGTKPFRPRPDALYAPDDGSPARPLREVDPHSSLFRPLTHTGYQHWIEIHAAAFVHVGHTTHAATRAFRIRNGVWGFAWDRCNHGRCPMLMPFQCAFISDWSRQYHVHNQPCNTGYNVFSLNGGHNCNDDTAIEYETVRINFHLDGYNSRVCNDWNRHDYFWWCW